MTRLEIIDQQKQKAETVRANIVVVEFQGKISNQAVAVCLEKEDVRSVVGGMMARRRIVLPVGSPFSLGYFSEQVNFYG